MEVSQFPKFNVLFSEAGIAEHAPLSAAEQADIAVTLNTKRDGTYLFSGKVLIWNLQKSDFLTLTFNTQWFASNMVELYLWSTSPVQIEIQTEQSIRFIEPGSETLGFCLGELGDRYPESKYLVLECGDGGILNETPTRLTLRAKPHGNVELGRIFFGIERRRAAKATRVRRTYTWNERTRIFAATWCNIFFGLFALFGGVTWYVGFALIALPFLPELLKRVGVSAAFKFDLSALASWIHNTQKGSPALRWSLEKTVVRIWCVSSLVFFALALYVGASLLAPYVFKHRLEEALEASLHAPAENFSDATLFCSYPERLEARALLARRYVLLKSDRGAWQKAQQKILETINLETFIGACLSKWRFARLFVENQSEGEDEARVFYASLLFDTLSGKPEDYAPALIKVSTVLQSRAGTKSGPLAALALAMYELRSVKNIAERLLCSSGNADALCISAMHSCSAARERLENMLKDAEKWSKPNLRQQVTYIEARDVAASTALSFACSAVQDADIKVAINHYWTMLGAIPIDPRLDRSLSQINLRNLASSRLEPERYLEGVADGWRKECSSNRGSFCKDIQEAVIGSGERRFFSKDRIVRNADWDKPSLSLASVREFREIVLAEATRNWRPPW